MIKAASYARYSSDLQNEDSIDAQLREIRKYALDNKITIIHDYIDQEKSGKTDDRPEFQQMIADAKKGMFEVIILHKIDRFARNRYDSAIYKAQLKRCGVKLLYAAQHISDSPEGRLMEGILESFAEYYSDNLATEVLKGMKTKALRGEFTGGFAPLGFDVVDGKYIINEYEANIIRKIFEMYAEGYSYGDIFKEMIAKGYKTKFNVDFGKNSLYSILANKKYIGTMEYNKAVPRTPGHRNGHKSKPEAQIIVKEGVLPAIIDNETWLKVQQRKLHSKNKAQTKAIETYLLTGLVECGSCGANMGGHRTANKNQRVYKYYLCKGCGNRVNKDDLENRTFDILLNEMFSDESIEKYANRLNEHIKSKFNKSESEIQKSKAAITKIDKEINNIVNAIVKGIASSALEEKLLILEQAKKDLTYEMLLLKHSEDTFLYSPKEIKESLEKYKSSLEARDLLACKQFINKFIKKTISKGDIIAFEYCLDTTGAGERT